MTAFSQPTKYPNLLPECIGDIEIICQYHNTTNRFQIIRVDNVSVYFLERAILPGGRFTFKSSPQALLKVITHEYIGACLSAIIPCLQLKIFSC